MTLRKKIISFLTLPAFLLGMVSCNNTKYLPANESLYTGASVDVKAPGLNKKKKKALEKELDALTRPVPNKSIFGLRPKLWFWNIGGNPKKKLSVKRLIKNMGEPPVVLSDLNIEKNNQVLQSFLQNQGFFNAVVTGETKVKNKRANAIYTAETGSQYTIREVFFENDSTDLGKAIYRTRRNSFLKKGRPFNLDMIKEERTRIDGRLKQRGFYFFNPDHIIIDVDSTIGNHEVHMYVKTKKEMPSRAKRIYRINDVVIYPNYSINAESSDTSKKYGITYEGYQVIDSAKIYKPKLFLQAMQFQKGDIYKRSEHNATLNRLINLGIFKFVKNNFTPDGDTLLNANYYLTPLPKKSLRVEIGGNTKSNNLTGSQITVGFTNRNTFRGGEILSVNGTAGMEVQYSGQFRGFNTYRLGGEAKLAIPRFVVPFVSINPRGGFVPRTNVQLGYDILNRQRLYTLNSFRAQYGYSWKETQNKEHTFNPISIQYVRPIAITQLYKDSLLNNPTLQKVIDTQFILGANYNYLFNQLVGRVPDNAFYFNGVLDVSGNIAGLIKKNIIKEGDTARLFGAPFSQYLKVETDLRYYRKLGGKNVWANRLSVGAGFPYGNSRELPFIKQFFVGGNNSLRAFRSRSLGPGTYLAGDAGSVGFIPDQSGDIKLEFNTELRFQIVHPVYGALFVDAGNIWLYNDNINKPGAKFTKDFMKELAAGTGLGLRVDISILVLRLDLAFPLRKPWLPETERWVIDRIDFGDSQWRKQNLVFNLAIGYPF